MNLIQVRIFLIKSFLIHCLICIVGNKKSRSNGKAITSTSDEQSTHDSRTYNWTTLSIISFIALQNLHPIIPNWKIRWLHRRITSHIRPVMLQDSYRILIHHFIILLHVFFKKSLIVFISSLTFIGFFSSRKSMVQLFFFSLLKLLWDISV